jgi:hypothetical protein
MEIMKARILLVVGVIAITGCSTEKTTVAKLDFPLPRRARYTVTDQKFEAAKALLWQDFSPDTNKLKTIISAPIICGPGLWHLLKDSPYFTVPPRAASKAVIPLANKNRQELPIALLQDDKEASNFRAALSDLLAKNGDLKFRLPTKQEFDTFWKVTPFDTISEPLLVAEGDHYNLIIEFSEGRPFWFDEVRNMHSEPN